jgi:hypothetical protein
LFTFIVDERGGERVGVMEKVRVISVKLERERVGELERC